MKERLLQIVAVLSFAIVIGVNYLAAAGILNNTDTGAISDRYTNQLTPAGYAFAIWSLIYLGIAGYVIYQSLPSNGKNPVVSATRTPFIISCAANASWLFAWHYNLIPLSLVLMAVLFLSLAFLNLKVAAITGGPELVLVKAPFNLYFGWVTLATILNVTITLIYLGAEPFSTMGSIASASLILLAAIIGIFVRFSLSAFLYPIALAWGITAIAVKQSGNTPVVVAAAIAVIVLLFAALWGAVKD